MTPDIDLSKLSHAEKDALIRSLLPLVGRLQAALARIAELEARLAKLERPAKTPDNSSRPPSTGQKPDVPADGKLPRKGRPGVARALEPNPDRITDAKLKACPHCAAAWPDAPQTPQMVYDRIELPPVRPDVTRVRLFGGRCACCGERATAPAPDGLELGSPFGTSIEALVVYLHYAQAIGFKRLRMLMGEVFGLSLSEGAISNILARAQMPLVAAAAAIAAQVTTETVVASDETSVRVAGKTGFSAAFKRLLLRAVAIGRRRDRLRHATLELLGLYSVVTLYVQQNAERLAISPRRAAWYPKPAATFADAIARLRHHLWFERIVAAAATTDITEPILPAMQRIIEAVCYAP